MTPLRETESRPVVSAARLQRAQALAVSRRWPERPVPRPRVRDTVGLRMPNGDPPDEMLWGGA
jgi:hypothetical protein